MPLMFLSGKERRANGEIITGNHILRAMDNIPVYYARPDTPLTMLQRTVEMGRVVREVLGPGTGIYANGYPCSGGYSLLIDSYNTPPLVQEIQRHIMQERDNARTLLGNRASDRYHCLSKGAMSEANMIGTAGGKIDYTEQIYKCPHCKPSVQRLFASFPDVDIYAIVDDCPPPEVLSRIDMEGRRRGLFQKYTNLPGIIQAYANLGDTSPPLAIDYFMVKKDDIRKILGAIKGCDWVNLKVPCQMLRNGTQTYRPSFLEFGKNLVLDLQLIFPDGEMHVLLENAVTELLNTISSDDLLSMFQDNSTASSKLLYADPVIQRAVKLRHDMIRSQGLKSLES